MEQSTSAALEAHKRGFIPLPLKAKVKIPLKVGWQSTSYENASAVEEVFEEAASSGATNVGVLLGEKSGNLVDVDLDHPKTSRVKNLLLPPTSAISGRDGRPGTHYWYIAEEGTLPGTRRYKLHDQGTVTIELRSTGAQTAIAPSTHPSGDTYRWEADAWGGEAGPAVVNGRKLAVQVALMGLATQLIEVWPTQGGRHDAYLALAGGLLRYGEGEPHPYWKNNAGVLIRALADATLDEDGGEAREAEVIGTTVRRISQGSNVAGFGKLAEMLGDAEVSQIRHLVAEVESLAGFQSRASAQIDPNEAPSAPLPDAMELEREILEAAEKAAQSAVEDRDPLSERVVTWQPVDLEPYLLGQATSPAPALLTRSDGQSLLYPGVLNMLYGSSESAKSWIALWTCLQEMRRGERVVYLDFEDGPLTAISRLRSMGATLDDIRMHFTYIRPEEPMAPMQRTRWGQASPTDNGKLNLQVFEKALEQVDPSLIIADGMTMLYGLHGLDSNDSVSTDVITTWLKKLSRNNRSTVIIVDHSSKSAERGTLPIGSQHKVAMVQGAMFQVWPVQQPMPGAVGEVELIVVKDRPGEIRKISGKVDGKAQSAALVKMDSTVEGRTQVVVSPPVDPGSVASSGIVDLSKSKEAEKKHAAAEKERARKAEIESTRKHWREQVLMQFGGTLGEERTMPQLISSIPDPIEHRIRAAVADLVEDGWLAAEGGTKARRYSLTTGDAPSLSDLAEGGEGE